MSVQEGNQTRREKPWDLKSLQGFSRLGVGSIRFLLILLFPAAIVVMIYIVAIVIRDREFLSAWQLMGLLAAFVVALFICLVVYKIDSLLHRKLWWTTVDEDSKGARVSHLPRGLRRCLYGDADPMFLPEGMRVRGLLTPHHSADLMAALAIIAGVYALSFLALQVLRLRMIVVMANGVAGFLALILLLKWTVLEKDEDTSIDVTRDNIKSMKCEGPVVSMSFSCPPVRGLKAIRLFIRRSNREWFFRQFEKAFPGLLPSEYRNALHAAEQSS